MPLYTYTCPRCGARYELIRKPEDRVTCFHCDATLSRHWSAPGLVKGPTESPADRERRDE